MYSQTSCCASRLSECSLDLEAFNCTLYSICTRRTRMECSTSRYHKVTKSPNTTTCVLTFWVFSRTVQREERTALFIGIVKLQNHQTLWRACRLSEFHLTLRLLEKNRNGVLGFTQILLTSFYPLDLLAPPGLRQIYACNTQSLWERPASLLWLHAKTTPRPRSPQIFTERRWCARDQMRS